MGNGVRKASTVSWAVTPGPWTRRATLSGVQIVGANGAIVASTPCCDRQALADGALIVSAFTLLAACKSALEAIQRENCCTMRMVPELTSAIAEAEGAA
jgi:hypothetical protein